MTYRWTPEGPAFDFPSPYLALNRLLLLRGALLLLCAVALVGLALWLGGGDGQRLAIELEETTHEAPALGAAGWAALWLALLAGADFWQARRQRTLVLVPGQPASLMPEVSREGTGQSPGAAALLRLLASAGPGKPPADAPPPAAEVWGPWRAWGAPLLRTGPELAAAPNSLHAYLRQRIAHGVLALGLLLCLLASAWVGAAGDRRTGAAVAALLLVAVAVAAVVWPLLRSKPREWQPRAVGLVLAAAVLLAALALGLSAQVPRGVALQRLGLPWAAGLLLVGALLVQWLGLRAVRAQVQALPTGPALVGKARAETVELGPQHDALALMREVDLELHRRWSEGIPNRRYAWQTPQPVRADADGAVGGLLLEESQPLSAAGAAASAAGSAAATPAVRPPWLLSALALAASLAGALLWLDQLVMALRSAAAPAVPAAELGSAPWAGASLGLACLLLGLYTMRVAQLLWSRIELQSTLTCLEFQGRCRPAAAGGAAGAWGLPGSGSAPAADDAVPMASLRLRARVLHLRSVLYAAAPHRVGSRGLLALRDDAPAAAAWATLLATRSGGTAAPATAAPAPPAPAPVPRPAPAAASMPRTQPPARALREAATASSAPVAAAKPQRGVHFCPACGTSVTAGARFCQHCGAGLPPG